MLVASHHRQSANACSIHVLALFFDVLDHSLDDLGDLVTLGGHQTVQGYSEYRTTWRMGEVGCPD